MHNSVGWVLAAAGEYDQRKMPIHFTEVDGIGLDCRSERCSGPPTIMMVWQGRWQGRAGWVWRAGPVWLGRVGMTGLASYLAVHSLQCTPSRAVNT